MVKVAVGKNQGQKRAPALQTLNLRIERGIVGVAIKR
jgi:hypothetical protein